MERLVMVDQRVVEERLQKLEEYVKILRELQKVAKSDFLSDPRIYGSTERFLQLAIECVLDVGNHIIASEGLQKPNEYKEIPLILASKEIIPEKFSDLMFNMAKFRNLLVHDYMKIDREEVYRILHSHLDDFRAFAMLIEKFLSKKKN